MATVNLKEADFEETINNNDIVIVDFWAPWCGPCRSFAPIFESTSEKYPDIVFAKVNTDEERGLAGNFQIRSIPTLMIFREKIIVFSQPGSLPGSTFEEVIGKVKDLDMDVVRKEMSKPNDAANS
ncbi:MAG: thioredoxin [Gammaproteobacteria bacterium]|nr:MAG: thioredoxin [Gammaproteobacteria bacterium]RKZ39490.1 MAG: thioredoxin [Gammaproteobacteria bacterium]RKZ77029.1 MAG: thioredoxin [Gammaproteobacteria bacterium]